VNAGKPPTLVLLAAALLLLPSAGCRSQGKDCAQVSDCAPTLCSCGRAFRVCDLDQKKCVTDCTELCDLPHPDASPRDSRTDGAPIADQVLRVDGDSEARPRDSAGP
jgi:hypothetical protein